MTRIQKIISVAVLLLVLTGMYIFIIRNNKQIVPGVDTDQTTATTTNGKVVVNTTGGYKIEQVPMSEGQSAPQPIPDLNRPVRPPGSVTVTTEAVTLATSKILPLQVILKKNPLDFSSWIDLGIFQKMAGDYEGTSLSWQYASKIAPTDYVSLGNLGNLYAYFIKDNAKSEKYYLAAIKNGPAQEYLYTQFVEVYRDFFHDNTKALNIVNQGLSKLPDNYNLLRLKTSLSVQ